MKIVIFKNLIDVVGFENPGGCNNPPWVGTLAEIA